MQKNNLIESRTMNTRDAVRLIVDKAINVTTLRQMAISPDGEKVYVKFGPINADQVGSEPIERKGQQGYRYIGWLETDGQKLLVAAEEGAENVLANNATLVKGNMTELFGALQTMLLADGQSHKKAGTYASCALELPAEHEDVQTWIGSSERLMRLSTGRAGDLQNVRLAGANGAFATKGNKLVHAKTDDKGRITPATRWNTRFDFAQPPVFLSKIDLKDGMLVVTRADHRYQAVDINDILAGNPEASVKVGTAYEGDGALYIGHTAGRTHVATIGRDHDGQKRTQTFQDNGDTRRLPAGAQAARGTQAQT